MTPSVLRRWADGFRSPRGQTPEPFFGLGRSSDVLTLFQAEWCPFSSAVRERLTELGVDFVARQVPPWPEERDELHALTGTREIPTLQIAEGDCVYGTREIFAYLAGLERGAFEVEHRGRYDEHADARVSDATGRLLDKAAPLGERAA
jgi:glutaredoxin